MILKLELNIRPVPHQSVRFTRSGRTFKPKKITDYQSYVQRLVKEQLPEEFTMIPAGVPIFVRQLSYQYEWPSSISRKKRVGKVYKVTKPDLQDNLNKAFLDSLEGLIYEQDQNIVSIEKLEKHYGEKDKIILILEYDA